MHRHLRPGMVLVAALLMTACGGSTAPDAAGSGLGTGGSAGSAPVGPWCETPAYPLISDGVDRDSQTTLWACVEGSPGRSSAVRIELEGTPVCEDLARPCVDPAGNPCEHRCEADADCPTGSVCVCAVGITDASNSRLALTFGQGPNECLVAGCTSSASCNGFACGMTRSTCGPRAEGFQCFTAADTCSTDADCGSNQICRFSSNHWTCEELLACD